MKNYLPNEDLNMLNNIKDEICITIISPTHHLATDRKANQLQLENCIRNTDKKLRANYDEATVDRLMKDINQLYNEIDSAHLKAGIGLFVSTHVKKITYYFSEVKESITIDRVFNLKDTIYENAYNVPYALILLSKKEVRLA